VLKRVKGIKILDLFAISDEALENVSRRPCSPSLAQFSRLSQISRAVFEDGNTGQVVSLRLAARGVVVARCSIRRGNQKAYGSSESEITSWTIFSESSPTLYNTILAHHWKVVTLALSKTPILS
jgi:hypothetical protein